MTRLRGIDGRRGIGLVAEQHGYALQHEGGLRAAKAGDVRLALWKERQVQPRRLEGRGRAVVRVADQVAALAVLPEGVGLEQRRRQQPAQQARRHKGLRAELPREIARDEQ